MTTEIKLTDCEFAQMIMIENYHLHIIAFNADSVLAVDKDTNKAYFFYEVNEDMSFHFNLLSEVGQKYQSWFTEMINVLHYNIGIADTPTDYYNTLTSS